MTRKSLNTLGLGLLVCLICYYNASRLRPARDLSYAIHAISESYVDPVSEVDLKDAAMIGMLESLDRYSGYIPPRSFGRFNALFEQRFAGIGVRIQDSNTEISTGTDGGQPSGVRVIATLFNSPAFRAGILPGDEIIEVNRQDVRNCKLADLSPMLMGAVGTSVQLAIDRGGARFDFEIIREEVEVESITGDRRNRDGTWEYLLQADPRIAYIHADL